MGAERSRRGRDYVPGFLFRLLFLVVALWVPALGSLLILPLGLLALWKPASVGLRRVWVSLGFLPWLLLGLVVAVLGVRGRLAGWDLELGHTLVLLAALVAFTAWMQAPDRVESVTSEGTGAS